MNNVAINLYENFGMTVYFHFLGYAYIFIELAMELLGHMIAVLNVLRHC